MPDEFDQLSELLIQRATSNDPELQGFAGYLEQSIKKPLDRKYALQNALRNRNSEYLLNALSTGKAEGYTPEEQKLYDQLMMLLPIPGPTKVASTASRFIPSATETGINLMGKPVVQKSFPTVVGKTGADFLQEGRAGISKLGGLLRNILSRPSATRALEQQRNTMGQFTDIFK